VKRPFVFLLCLSISAAILSGQEAPAQAVGPFYNVDKEVRIEGAVREIRFEPRYKDRTPFLILVLRDPKSGEAFSVEVSPSWFFRQDLHQGERMTVVGSLAGEGAVIARQLRLRGETVNVRDKKGFPAWSRGAAMAKGKRGVGGL